MDGTEEDAKWLPYAKEGRFRELLEERYCRVGRTFVFRPDTCVGVEAPELGMAMVCIRCGRRRMTKTMYFRFLFALGNEFDRPAE